MKPMHKFLIGLLALSLCACAGAPPRPATVVYSTGNVGQLEASWDNAASVNIAQPAPVWAKQQYANSLRVVNALESELKETKAAK